ncbi:hypothetical protein [Streptomyces griseofuscus]|uniref:hypothetical protein n=1 Tax=Streptomyces griseofuscus TaxID=146922 RepID=UPI003454AD75
MVVTRILGRQTYDGGLYRLTMRRLLRNTGSEPITRYLIRISVDRCPGEPERSNAHYREHPLTWDELAFPADLDPVVWGTETSDRRGRTAADGPDTARGERDVGLLLEHRRTRTPRPVPSGMAVPRPN